MGKTGVIYLSLGVFNCTVKNERATQRSKISYFKALEARARKREKEKNIVLLLLKELVASPLHM